MTTNGNTPPIDAWQVESMRVTVFPSELVNIERIAWWDDSVGSPPEAVTSRPKTGQYQAIGEFEGRRLTLQVQPGRVDWTAAAIIRSPEDDSDLIGPFPEVLASLLKIVSAWLPSAPAMKRIAFGAVLLQGVDDIRGGLMLIKNYVRTIAIDADESSDFFYQINRPRGSRVIGIRINRLMKWSVQIGQRVIMTVGGEGVVTRTIGHETAARLELDINTDAQFADVLPANQLEPLVHEMTDLAKEIAQKGDVR